MTIKIKKILVAFSLLVAVFAAAHFALAATADVGLNYAADIGLPANDPRIIAANIIRIALGFLGIIAVGLIIYAGWLYMTAAGEEEKVEKAKKILIGAVIGLLICLASFAIATFILSKLSAAVSGNGDGTTCSPACSSGQYCCNSSCSNSPCGNIGSGGGETFNVRSTSPRNLAAGVVRNITVKSFFNSVLGNQVSQAVLENNFKVEKIATVNPVDKTETALAAPEQVAGAVALDTTRSVISFKDSDACGDEKNTPNCLPEWTKFKITIDGMSGIVSINNQSLDCTAGAKCQFVFSTSNLIDGAGPEAGVSTEQICQDDGSLKPDANTVSGWAKDDNGISAIRFFQQKDGQAKQDVFAFPGNGLTYQQDNYQYDTHDLAVGDKYNFGINVFDLSDNAASSSFSSIIRPGHCCNGVKDTDETEIDCGGNVCMSCGEVAKPVIYNVSPLGGFCSADNNKFCITDADCGSAGACNHTTPNGAVGNFVTVSGRYFGASAGQLFFNDKQAVLANTINDKCSSPWQDSQIIVVVPAGAENGPMKVVNTNGNFDTTNNNNGPAINDFLVNSIKRPGLCLVNPNKGSFNDIFNLQGNAFNGSTRSVLFGNDINYIAANGINWSGDNLSVNATVPNVSDGQNSIYIKTGNISSNNLAYMVSGSAAAPVIEYLEPVQGPIGQYITIYGRNFKAYQAGKSAVKFYLPADPTNLILADTDFPDACKNSWWRDGYIIVKAPNVGIDKLGDYKVIVITGESRQSAPADFKIISGDPGPGICALAPHNGPVGQAVSASGDNFGSSQGANGRAVFYSNISGSISNWADQTINTSVPNGAQTGPFKAVDNNSNISNSLPFTVGKCSSTGQCEVGEECCAAGTFWSGICQLAGTCSLGGAKSCTFGWSFKTGQKQVGDLCYSGATAGSCDISKSNCGTSLVCDPTSCVCKKPCNSDLNSDPKKCVPDNNKCTGSDTPVCNLAKCLCECRTNDDCKNGETCDPNTNTCTSDTLYSCAGYGDQCSDSYFCPNSPGKCSSNAGGPVNAGVKCGDDACKDLSRCLDEDKNNLCSYSSTLNKCKKTSGACDLAKTVSDINSNQVELKCGSVDSKSVWYYDSSQTCISGYTKNVDNNKCLGPVCNTCDAGFSCAAENGAGVCAADKIICPAGSSCSGGECVETSSSSCECCCDKTQNNPAGGNPACCSGLNCNDTCGGGGNLGLCTGCTVAGDQSASNAKCNCTGTSGKFCNMAGAGGLGTCLDCTALKTTADCNQQGAGACCVDAVKGSKCRGGTNIVHTGYDSNNYCAYYKCNSSGDSCNATNPLASSTAAVYNNAQCSDQCKPAPQFGQECSTNNTAAATESCNANICSNYSCLDENAYGIGSPYNPSGYMPSAKNNTCGTCCCDPNAAADQCQAINSQLSCLPNKAPCSGDKRGLCCGCSLDSDCGSANAIGCGADTCCVARPSMIDTKPYGGDICRNSLIQATFNQPMQISSFSDNVIVAGDYGLDPCPAGTKYLTSAYKPSVFARIESWLAKLPLIGRLLSHEAKAAVGNFCTVDGIVSGEIRADNTTLLKFAPQKVFAANRKYYVIIKGETDITDALHDGVLNQNGIGMNPTDDQIFNGITYKGKIWYFVTKDSSPTSSGICQIGAVAVNPSSYLFNTTVNDPVDDSDATKDQSIKDGDKIFIAQAFSANGQPIVPIENVYNWRWDWTVDNQNVVKFKNGVNALDDNPTQTLVAQNIKEASTLVHAKTTITQDQINRTTTVGKSMSGLSQVYVFLCANPWPSYKIDTSGNLIWEPWQDEAGNCSIAGGGCDSANYELYYCRDTGQTGTANNLPAIQSDNAIIRGKSTEQNILKEFYFFREGLPDVSGINLTAVTNDEVKHGGKVGLTWQAVANAQKYTIYYGTSAANLTQSVPVPAGAAQPFIIGDLTNGIKYYFAITATYNTGAESEYSNQTAAIPADVWAPLTPTGLAGATDTGSANLSWTDNSDDTSFYKLYYGATSGSLGASASLDKNQCVGGNCTLKINNLNSSTTYYFAVSAVDGYKNESNKSAEINLIIK